MRTEYRESEDAGGYAEIAARMLADAKGRAIPAATKKAWSDGKLTPGHIDKRASRYVEKRLLRMLWQAWRGTSSTA